VRQIKKLAPKTISRKKIVANDSIQTKTERQREQDEKSSAATSLN
jgi:hypothetical protein